MESKKNVVIEIHSSDEEEDFKEKLEKMKEEGTIDPDYARFLEARCKEDSGKMTSSSAYKAPVTSQVPVQGNARSQIH